MKRTLVRYDGRPWGHQQLHGLMVRLLEGGIRVEVRYCEAGRTYSLSLWQQDRPYRSGHGCGSNLWLALVEAVDALDPRGGAR